MYEYLYDLKFKAIIEREFKVTASYGSFSCIADLEHLNASAINIGTGYHNEHSSLAYVDLDELAIQITKFKRFFKNYKHKHFSHAERFSSKKLYNWEYDDMYYSSRFGWVRENFEDSELYPRCENCYALGVKTKYRAEYDLDLCDYCYADMVYYDTKATSKDADFHDSGDITRVEIICEMCGENKWCTWEPEFNGFVCDECIKLYDDET